MEFTEKQFADFAAYVRVQYEGLYNMFSREARYATGLNEDEYKFVMRNYGELLAASSQESVSETDKTE